MTETVTSLLPFRTTMPVLLAGCTRHSERPSLSGGGAGRVSPLWHPAAARGRSSLLPPRYGRPVIPKWQHAASARTSVFQIPRTRTDLSDRQGSGLPKLRKYRNTYTRGKTYNNYYHDRLLIHCRLVACAVCYDGRLPLALRAADPRSQFYHRHHGDLLRPHGRCVLETHHQVLSGCASSASISPSASPRG